MDYKIITEGQTKLKIPDSPGLSSSEEVFYNPHMSLSRDFTVGLTRVCKSESFADVLAATGARGVRVANECDLPVSMNDLNPYAVKLMRENAKLNGIDAEIKSVDAKKFLSENRFDYVDLDPFGTPCNLVDMAFDAVKFGGIMGVCATDTSALCGSHPKACIRKYGASPYRSDFYDEAGLRLLIAFCAKNALKHEFGIKPLLSHSTRHYMRVQFQLTRKTSDTSKKIKYMQYCHKCLNRDYKSLDSLENICSCGEKNHFFGPVWSSKFADVEVLNDLALEKNHKCLENGQNVKKYVTLISEEQIIEKPYYQLHKITKKAKTPAPRMDILMECADDVGVKMTRTHFDDTGVRCDCDANELKIILEKALERVKKKNSE